MLKFYNPYFSCIEQGDRYLTTDERAEQAQQLAVQEQRQRERLETFLRSQGFDPDHLPDS